MSSPQAGWPYGCLNFLFQSVAIFSLKIILWVLLLGFLVLGFVLSFYSVSIEPSALPTTSYTIAPLPKFNVVSVCVAILPNCFLPLFFGAVGRIL